eukprot:1148014-Pelagomonas_calceolata.AAC.1
MSDGAQSDGMLNMCSKCEMRAGAPCWPARGPSRDPMSDGVQSDGMLKMCPKCGMRAGAPCWPARGPSREPCPPPSLPTIPCTAATAAGWAR